MQWRVWLQKGWMRKKIHKSKATQVHFVLRLKHTFHNIIKNYNFIDFLFFMPSANHVMASCVSQFYSSYIKFQIFQSEPSEFTKTITLPLTIGKLVEAISSGTISIPFPLPFFILIIYTSQYKFCPDTFPYFVTNWNFKSITYKTTP